MRRAVEKANAVLTGWDGRAAVRNPTSSNRLAGSLEALAIDCENTDGWEGAASDLREAARYLAADTAIESTETRRAP